MHPLISALLENLNLPADPALAVPLFLGAHGHPRTCAHCAAVAAECRRLGLRFGVDPDLAALSGWLHDISAVWPASQRLSVARELDLPILPAERQHPMLLHQRLSAGLAEQAFGVSDPAVLSAIACHTTLRPNPAPLDLLLFCADKLAWDQPGQPPYLDAMQAALDDSLPAAAAVYLRHLWRQREFLPAVHPLLIEAWEFFGIEE
ncbi:predicted HD superfamily hydrolase [Longilinea arvoryzae]|uniref:Predicted HD superfamily hydrolase n=1 Tax=Longilinea arvoryzae TaxID=360412 RepID=A0A0K8MZH1_9CHLR|nr:HD domain-containing protein [Longilinea arvoryzae]GAP16042.1 predicted HD superfamily hydrolase [Longilinea arvoryzae]